MYLDFRYSFPILHLIYLHFAKTLFILKHYDSNMLKAFFLRWLISSIIYTAGTQHYREREMWKEERDGEVIVHSQGAVGEVKHIAWGLFHSSLSCGCDCVFWLLRFRLCARWTLTCCLLLFNTFTDFRLSSLANLCS